MPLNHRQEGAATVVTIGDEALDHTNESAFRKLVRALLAEGRTALVVDLSGVTQVSSLGLGALVTAHREVDRSQGTYRLAGIGPEVQSMMRLTQLDGVLEIFPTLEDALRA